MPSICEALNRPIREPHLVANAPAAKVDLLLSGVAVDRHARFTTENEASKVYEASPWAADKRAAETVRQAPVQTDERVPPKGLARDMAFAKLQSRILSAAEAVQAVKLHTELSPEQQAIMLSAGGDGTGTSWTATHKSPTELAQNAQWRMATALRHGATPDAGPRSTCALRRDNDGHMCKQSLATHPFHPFCCKYGGARNRPHRAVQCTLRRLIEQAGDHADMERRVPELYDWEEIATEQHPRCGARFWMWSPGSGVSCSSSESTSVCDARMQIVTTIVRRDQERLHLLGKRRNQSAMEWPCDRWFSRPVEDWAMRAPSCCVTW